MSLNAWTFIPTIFGEDLVPLSTKSSLSYPWDGALHANIDPFPYIWGKFNATVH